MIIAALAVAGSSYLWFQQKVSASNDKVPEAVKEVLDAGPPPTPLVTVKQSDKAYNIILLGGDTRSNDPSMGTRSDTIMVIHVDPELNFASVLSVPRDLYVNIPGHGKNRINAAYAFGGPQLTITTVKSVFGLDITKYAEVDFQAFQKMVDSLGGVYVDIDRRYLQTKPRAMDIQPGYQLLNGANALLFARFRYDQNADWGRQIRQQRVIAAIREQAMGWNLPLKLPGLISSTLESMATNFSASDMLKLATWIIKLDGSRIRQIQIKAPSQMINGASVVVASQDTMKDAITKFLTAPGEDTEDSTPVAAMSAVTSTTDAGASATTHAALSTGSSGSGTDATTEPSTESSTTSATQPAAGSTTTSSVALHGLLDPDKWAAAQKNVPFPLEGPQFLPEGYAYSSTMPANGGTYQIDPGGNSKPAVRVLYRLRSTDTYLSVSATKWTDAPIASKGAVTEENGVQYTVVGTSGKVDHIWWKKDGVLYWISNTLMYSVGKKDLLKMATTMTAVPGNK